MTHTTLVIMTTHVDTLIVGAGLSGIGTACRLAREFPERTVAILERRERVGGTWDLFRYPGIRSDSDMFTFGYDFRPWHDLKVLADGDAIRQYVEDTAVEYGLLDKVQFGVKVLTAEWSSADELWTVTALHEATGETRVLTASFLISCTGYYSHDAGHLPEFAGIEDFGGQVVHPQFWPEDFDYTGKKVVVIGSGATAVTLVPIMSEQAEHVTMLQRSPSYIISIPSYDKISEVLGKFLPQSAVYRFGRWRNIGIQRGIYLASRRWPKAMRKFLLSQAEKQLGPDVDMAHFTPSYMPWDERLCAVPNGDLFTAVREGHASVVTDHIDSFTETGIRLTSGAELEADVVVTATGLNIEMLGNIELTIDGEPRRFEDQMTYKATLIEGIPNFGWIFGYTNAPWTLKSGIAAEYLCRLLRQMDQAGHAVVVPRDRDGQALPGGMLDALQSGYVQRAKDILPRQGKSGPWQVRMHYGQDKKMLLEDPIADGNLEFSTARVSAEVPA